MGWDTELGPERNGRRGPVDTAVPAEIADWLVAILRLDWLFKPR